MTNPVRRYAGAGALALILAAWQAPGAMADELSDFRAAVDVAGSQYQAALRILDTGGRREAAAAVARFRQSWQVVIGRFADHRPSAFADDQTVAAALTQVDASLVGALIVIDIGNREAARAALAPIGDTLSRLSGRSTPAPN